jgi:hypothetical protein
MFGALLAKDYMSDQKKDLKTQLTNEQYSEITKDFTDSYTHFRKAYLESILKITGDTPNISATTLISGAMAALLDLIADANLSMQETSNKNAVDMDYFLSHFFLIMKNTPELHSQMFKDIINKMELVPESKPVSQNKKSVLN